MITRLAVVAVFATSTVACEATKSSSPTSPAVAGPIPGVSITAPTPLSPTNGSEVLNSDPLRLVFANASSNSPRTFWYIVELAVDPQFNSKLYTAPHVVPVAGSETSVVVEARLATEATYYWRVKADDGANASDFSPAARFDLVVPVVIGAPALALPPNGATVGSSTPELVVNNGKVEGRAGVVEYRYEVARDQAFTAMVSVGSEPRSGGSTTTHRSAPLPDDTTLFWRVTATNGRLSSTSGVWAFRTPSGGGGNPPPGSPGSGDWRTCGSTPGDALVRCVHAAINPSHTVEGAFEVTKRVAWLLRGGGGGLLIKTGGENIVSWKGYSFAAARICYPDGHIWKVLSDVPTTNGPSWQDNGFVDRSLYLPALDPDR